MSNRLVVVLGLFPRIDGQQVALDVCQLEVCKPQFSGKPVIHGKPDGVLLHRHFPVCQRRLRDPWGCLACCGILVRVHGLATHTASHDGNLVNPVFYLLVTISKIRLQRFRLRLHIADKPVNLFGDLPAIRSRESSAAVRSFQGSIDQLIDRVDQHEQCNYHGRYFRIGWRKNQVFAAGPLLQFHQHNEF